MIQSILVPVDLSEDADRALPVAAALARQMHVPLRSVTVTSPGIRPTADEAEVRQHARRAGVVLDGVRLSYDEDVTGGILAQRDADQALLCCATHDANLGHADGLDRTLLVLPHRPSTDRLTTDVVRHAGCPVLAVPPLR